LIDGLLRLVHQRGEARARIHSYSLMPMTHAPETGPETGTRKLASVSGAGFSRQLQNFWRQKPTWTNKK